MPVGVFLAFLSITLKVAVEREFVGGSVGRCWQMFPVESVKVSITFVIDLIIEMNRVSPSKYHDRQTEKRDRNRKEVGRLNWCREECVCVGLCCFSLVRSECQDAPSTIVRRNL